jgi:hypothetical protein
MLSEIYFLKLEAAKRAADDAARVANARYVPLAPSIVPQKIVANTEPNTTPEH